ncbi:MAG: phage tail fiber protein [Candidatus Cloacimonetes bacterium]|nr:phage tail fiber protein [Candidatus Cloacimonadota bacterium]
MANSYVYYTGDGRTTNFQITFDYLSKEFVQVYLDGVLLDVDTDYIFAGDRTIVIPSIPPVDSMVFIQRVTSKNRLVEFRDASILIAKDLDVSALQAIHIAEEADDNTQKSIQANASGNFDALNRRLINLGAPVDGTDGVNKQYVDTRLDTDVANAVAARDASIVAQGLSEDARDASIVAQGLSEDARDASVTAKGLSESARDAAQGFANTADVRATQASGSAIVAAQEAQDALAAKLAAEAISVEAARRAYNYIINGNFSIWQRGVSQTTSGYGSDDRWFNQHYGTTTKTHTRQVLPISMADIGKYYSVTTVTSGTMASDYCIKSQRIEGVQTLAGKKATLSFYANGSQNSAIGIEFIQNFGTGGTPSSPITSIGVNKVNITTVPTRYTVTVDIPSVSGKTIGTYGTDYLEVRFWFSAGSNYITYSSDIGLQSGSFSLMDVSLVEGDVDVKYIPRSYGEELALCQRYYENGFFQWNGVVMSGLNVSHRVPFVTTKRTLANVTLNNIYYVALTRAKPVSIYTKGFGVIADTDIVNPGQASYSLHWTADAEL